MNTIKYTDRNGLVSYPSDLQGLSYNDCLTQLNLFEQDEFEMYESDRQTEDYLVLNHTDGTFESYEIN